MFRTLSLAALSCLVGKINGAEIYAGQGNFGNPTEVNFQVETNSERVKIRIVGPSDRWFGVGFGSRSNPDNAMIDTYAIIADEQSSEWVVTERKLGNKERGTLLTRTFTSSSVTIQGNNRVVEVERPLTVEDTDVYDFVNAENTDGISTIVAWGAEANAVTLAAHGVNNRRHATLTMQDTRYYGSTKLVPGISRMEVWLSGDSEAEVTIKLCTNDGNWAGVGFCGDAACGMDGTYALIRQDDNSPMERILGNGAAGTTVESGGTRTGISQSDSDKCFTFVRECEPTLDDDDDEAAIALPCSVDYAVLDDRVFDTYVIASTGGTAQWDGSKHTSAQAGIKLEMCKYMGGVQPDCGDGASDDDENGTADDSSAMTVSTMFAFLSMVLFTIFNF